MYTLRGRKSIFKHGGIICERIGGLAIKGVFKWGPPP